jgi:4-amino-4-deoxy-L-arabinose transferase-like glycosyltransferase
MRRTFRYAALILILALAAYLRLANLSYNPGWYTDEGTHLNIARHLIDGRIQYLAVTQSTLLFARMPLFELLLAAVMRSTGGGMEALRGLTGMLGNLSVGLLYIVIKRIQRSSDELLPLLAALMLAIYPQAVIYSRFGFSYNLLVPLVMLVMLCLSEYWQSRQRPWLLFAALIVGIGALSDLLMFVFAGPVLIVALERRWRDALWAAVLIGLPFALYSFVMLLDAPSAFVSDLRFTFFRVSALSLSDQLATLAINYTTLIAQDAWFALALIGLFMLRPDRLRNLALLMLLLPLIVLGRTVALFSLSAYYMIPLLPFIALGMASLLRYGIPVAVRMLALGLDNYRIATIVASSMLAILVMTPFLVWTLNTVQSVQTHYPTPIDPFLISGVDAEQAATYVNTHVSSDNRVIASPGVAWLIDAPVADFQMAVAVDGQYTPHLPADLPASRYAFDARFANARFVIVDNLWRNWAAPNIPAVAAMLREIEEWPLVFESGEIQVYENPAK